MQKGTFHQGSNSFNYNIEGENKYKQETSQALIDSSMTQVQNNNQDNNDLVSFIESEKQQGGIDISSFHNLTIERELNSKQKEDIQKHVATQIQSNRNMNTFNKSKYNTSQKTDDNSQMRKKSQIPYVQNELKTHLLYQQLDNCLIKNNANQAYDLPTFFQCILENLKLIYSRTKGQSINVKKIQELNKDLARFEITMVEKNYLIFFSYNDSKKIKNVEIQLKIDDFDKRDRINSGSSVDRVIFNKHIYIMMTEEEKEDLIKQIIDKQKSNEKSNISENSQIYETLALLEINRCFYNDQFFTKVYSFYTSLSRILQGDFNFIELLYIEDNNTPLTIHPCILGTRFYFEDRLADVKGDNTKKIYQKPSNLPSLIFINLDGFDHPINLEIIKRFTTFNYFSIFQEFFNPDGQFSFYKFLQNHSSTLKAFFPLFLPYLKHVEQFYEEKAKKKGYTESQKEQFKQEKLDGLYKGIITDEEFAFLFEEYIFSRVNDFSKIDIVIVSYSCVMSSFNERTNHIFQLSEEVFFNIFTHLARRTNFRMIFVPRLIMNTYQSLSDIPTERIYPGQEYKSINKHSYYEQSLDLQKSNTSDTSKANTIQAFQQELNEYETRIRRVFGINQIQERISKERVIYKYENLELIKYVQNITCGFFQLFNSLSNIQERENKTVFTEKKNILHWRFVNSIVYMQNRLYNVKNQGEFLHKKQNTLGHVKKEYNHMIEVLKHNEKLKIQSFSDNTSLDYQRELIRTLELSDSIFLFQVVGKKTDAIQKELYHDNIQTKKYKIVNSLNKACYMTKYSQHFVDYKNGFIYLFNILFPNVDKIQNDLINQLTNCVGIIPQGKDSKDNEIQVQKICDWKFSKITLGKQDELQHKRHYVLQESTIIPLSLKTNNNKYKFLLFFGGSINYFDKQRNEINLDQSSNIKNQCLYALKIGEKYYESEFVYAFEEIKIFGEASKLIKNLSYSSGAVVTYGEELINGYSNDRKYMFIFGGYYESDSDECTLQNMILYSSLTKTLSQIIYDHYNENKLIKEEKKGQSNPIQYQIANKDAIDYIISTQSNDNINDLIQLLENLDKNRQILEKDVIQQVYIFLKQQNINLKDKIESKEEANIYYCTALCYKIVGDYSKATQYFNTEGFMKQLCLQNVNLIAYYFGHQFYCGQILFEDYKEKLMNMLNSSDFESKLTLKQIQDISDELKYIQCPYLLKKNPTEARNILKQKLDSLSNKQIEQLNLSQLQTLGDINYMLSQCDEQNQEIHYQLALKFQEMTRTIPIKQRQNECYSIEILQIPKQNVNFIIFLFIQNIITIIDGSTNQKKQIVLDFQIFFAKWLKIVELTIFGDNKKIYHTKLQYWKQINNNYKFLFQNNS